MSPTRQIAGVDCDDGIDDWEREKPVFCRFEGDLKSLASPTEMPSEYCVGVIDGSASLSGRRGRSELSPSSSDDPLKSSCGSGGAAVANSGRGGIGEVSSWWGGSTLVETACFVAVWVRGKGGGWGRSVMDMVVCAKIKKC